MAECEESWINNSCISYDIYETHICTNTTCGGNMPTIEIIGIAVGGLGILWLLLAASAIFLALCVRRFHHKDAISCYSEVSTTEHMGNVENNPIAVDRFIEMTNVLAE